MTRYVVEYPSGVRMYAAGELDGIVIGANGYCPLDALCHADVLARLANGGGAA